MIWHAAGSARLALKSEWIQVSEFLITQNRWHSRCFETGLDGVYVTEILRAEGVDVGYDAQSDPFRIGRVLDVGAQRHVIRVMLASLSVRDLVELFDDFAKQRLRVCENVSRTGSRRQWFGCTSIS